MPGGVPLQSPRVPPAGRPFGGRRRLPEVPLPFDDVTRSGPVCSGPSGSAAVPTPGFRTPSPVSWLRSSLRVCFTPLPSLGSRLPSERSPRVQVAHPSSGSLAPSSFVPIPPRCGVRGLVTSGLHRLGRRSGVVPGRILQRLEAPFQRRSTLRLATARFVTPPGHPGPRTPGSPRPGSFRRPRSFLPCASPFTPRGGRPSRGGRCSPGRSRPSRALLPPSLGPSFTRHGRRRPSSRWQRAPLGASRDSKDLRASGHFSWLAPRAAPMLETLDVGWNRAGTTETSRYGTVGGHRTLRARAVPSSEDGSLDSHDLRCAALARLARRVVATVIATSAHQV